MTKEERDIILALAPEFVLALTIYGEARGETITGKIGVAHVVNNRFKDKRWPKTISEVCLQPKQFSCWNDADPNSKTLVEMSKHGINGSADMVWRECVWAAGGVVFKYVSDITKGANHYHTRTINPSWADKMDQTVTIGNHIFYKG